MDDDAKSKLIVIVLREYYSRESGDASDVDSIGDAVVTAFGAMGASD